MRRIPPLVVVLAMLAPGSAGAQFFERLSNPTITVSLTHPPDLGLKVTKIAFGAASGECSNELLDLVVADFVGGGIEVIDRQNLDAILAEQKLTASGVIDMSSAAALGKILGPTALVFIKTQRCQTMIDRLTENEQRHDGRTKSNYTVRAYHSRTRTFLKASVQTVDLATGRIFAARALDYSPEQRTKSYEGFPDPPAEFDVRDLALRTAVRDIHRMFLPWTEPRKLIFYDDKDCGLKQASDLLKAGDLDGAFRASRGNVETCQSLPKGKEKALAHAFYNVGMTHMLRNEFDEAIELFREAAKLRPGGIVNDAIADTQRARQLRADMMRVEERAAIAADTRDAASTKAAVMAAASTLSNSDVIEMAQSKLPDGIIISKIRNSKNKFDTSSAALVALAKAGVSEAVIIAMMTPH